MYIGEYGEKYLISASFPEGKTIQQVAGKNKKVAHGINLLVMFGVGGM